MSSKEKCGYCNGEGCPNCSLIAGRMQAPLASTEDAAPTCIDCEKCAKSAYSDSTTPGFMFDKCPKHRQPSTPSPEVFQYTPQIEVSRPEVARMETQRVQEIRARLEQPGVPKRWHDDIAYLLATIKRLEKENSILKWAIGGKDKQILEYVDLVERLSPKEGA